MFHTISDFEFTWSHELESTQKLFKHMTDRSLAQQVTNDHRTLGRIAWHIVQTIPEMMNRTGLTVAGPEPEEPVPSSAKQIFAAYNTAAISLLDQIKQKWNDASLEIKDDMYGDQWKRGQTLHALVSHQTHHRGQMTVLMRQAGLEIPGLFGPAKQEWAKYGGTPPAI